MAPAPPATPLERLALIPKLFFALGAALKHFLLYPITGDSETGLFRFVVYGALRRLLATISVPQEQANIKPSTTIYKAVAKELSFPVNIETTPKGLQVCWFGDKSTKKTVLFFHGGGYVLGASIGHVKWAHNLQETLGKDVRVAMPCYTLAPKGQYPLQITEAVDTLAWLLNDQRVSPSDIILAGDSAGGNLSLALLSHHLHHHSALSTRLSLSGTPLAGLLLISPWCKFLGDPSFKRNETTDYVADEVGARWSSLYLGPAIPDNYAEPFLTDAKWWEGVDRVVKDVFIWGGKGEALIDSIRAFEGTFVQAHSKTELVVTKGGHEEMIMDLTLGYKTKGDGQRAIESWCKKVLG